MPAFSRAARKLDDGPDDREHRGFGPARRTAVPFAAAMIFALVFAPIGALIGMPAAFAETGVALDPSVKAAPVAEPETYRTDEYRKPVPATLKGARVISPEEARDLWDDGKAVFIDVYPHAPKPPNLPANTVWREPQHFSIENAKWLANVGYGVLSAEVEAYFKRHLTKLSDGDKGKPLVFFCLRNCWMSWNSAKRALTYGYTNVLWFSEGFDAWQEIGQPIAEVKPEP